MVTWSYGRLFGDFLGHLAFLVAWFHGRLIGWSLGRFVGWRLVAWLLDDLVPSSLDPLVTCYYKF